MLSEILLASNYFTKAIAFLFIAFLTYIVWKQKFGQVTVNCWFCNNDDVVNYKEKNSWVCKHCQQYNGFDKAGDYNKFLPEMYDESLNSKPLTKQSSNETLNNMRQKVVLCEKCSRNQVLKFKQLSKFTPINENYYEIELEEYKQKLEKLYSLCSICQTASKRFIKLQDTMLRGQLKSTSSLFKRQDSYKSTVSAVHLNNQKVVLALMCHIMMLYLVAVYTFLQFNNARLIPLKLQCLLKFLFKYGTYETWSLITATFGWALSMSYRNLHTMYSPAYKYLIFWVYCLVMYIFSNYPQFNVFTQSDVFQPAYLLFPKSFHFLCTSIASVISISIPCILLIGYSSFNVFISIFFLISSKSYAHNVSNKLFQAYVNNFGDDSNSLAYNPSVNKVVKKSMVDKYTPKQKMPATYSTDMPPYDSNLCDDEDMDVVEYNNYNREPDLNCSLNALKLQDTKSRPNMFRTLKNSNDVSTGYSPLPSSLNTPPPSRSSSLLSLSSHHSFVASANPINKFGSTRHFAKPPDDLPFQKYKINYNTNCPSQSPFSDRSVASYNGYQTDVSNNQSNFSLKEKFKKPLLSPAKLTYLAKSQSKASLTQRLCNRKSHKTKDFYAAGDFEPDISASDSVSQVGGKFYPELSDNDDIPSTPHNAFKKSENLNSSSPKSAISNITSITMKSIAQVENSRLCRWILVICLLVNLILVVLLVLEVKEMRDIEQWKSKTTL